MYIFSFFLFYADNLNKFKQSVKNHPPKQLIISLNVLIILNSLSSIFLIVSLKFDFLNIEGDDMAYLSHPKNRVTKIIVALI